jgi:hypothetical protein
MRRCRLVHTLSAYLNHDNVGYLGGGIRDGTLVSGGTEKFVTDGAGLKGVARVGTRLANAVVVLVSRL